jgi:hypothetical protein
VIFLLSPERFIVELCSGAAISPTLVVTAAHCFPEPGQQVFVSFDADLTGDTDGDPVPHIVTGTWHPDPRFCRGCGPAPNSQRGELAYDGAVVVLDEPAAFERYAILPAVGELETLANQRPRVDVVGYGIQTRVKEFDPFTEPVTRHVAEAELSPGDSPVGADFLRLSANLGQGKGRVCAGDSGRTGAGRRHHPGDAVDGAYWKLRRDRVCLPDRYQRRAGIHRRVRSGVRALEMTRLVFAPAIRR